MGRANPAVLMRSEENKNKQLVVAMGGVTYRQRTGGAVTLR